MSKKKIYIPIIIVMIAAAFMVSYYWGMNQFKEIKTRTRKGTNISTTKIDQTVSNAKVEDIISENAKITIKTQYKKSGEVLISEEKNNDFKGKSKSEIEKLGYRIEKLNASEVILVKEVDGYPPNKYVLGIKDDYLAIFKTDKDGNMIIESDLDITEKKVQTLKKDIVDSIAKGSKEYVFNTKAEAESELEGYLP